MISRLSAACKIKKARRCYKVMKDYLIFPGIEKFIMFQNYLAQVLKGSEKKILYVVGARY